MQSRPRDRRINLRRFNRAKRDMIKRDTFERDRAARRLGAIGEFAFGEGQPDFLGILASERNHRGSGIDQDPNDRPIDPRVGIEMAVGGAGEHSFSKAVRAGFGGRRDLQRRFWLV